MGGGYNPEVFLVGVAGQACLPEMRRILEVLCAAGLRPLKTLRQRNELPLQVLYSLQKVFARTNLWPLQNYRTNSWLLQNYPDKFMAVKKLLGQIHGRYKITGQIHGRYKITGQIHGRYQGYLPGQVQVYRDKYGCIFSGNRFNCWVFGELQVSVAVRDV